jgi:acyl-CoA reductase-like NAD-dependent aldehyde dehydrogenase
MDMSFKLTYATMFNPPAQMHERFEAAAASTRAALGARHALFIGGADVMARADFIKTTPVDGSPLGRFPAADAAEVAAAVAAAKRAFPAWRATPVAERVRFMKAVAALIEERVYLMAAALCLEVGKNRMEGLGEAQEAADFFLTYAEEFERSNGYSRALSDDPLADYRSHNRSVLKPHGVWAVIAPFNFPLALLGGPTAAALVTGNTVVAKGATDTPWAGRLLADCIRDAGLPPGVFNYLTGSGSLAGEALVSHEDVAGITFTGSHLVGMHICRSMVSGAFPRPCIAEMGGKNAAIVTRNADLARAVPGIVRSAFGLSGQKCSALSRVYVEDAVADTLLGQLKAAIGEIRIGDPLVRENWLGPVISAAAAEKFAGYCARLGAGGGRILAGGQRLAGGEFPGGCYVTPTLAEAPSGHALFGEEMFLPILMVCRVPDLDTALTLTNDSALGLTAGMYGNEAEARAFLDRVEAGVTYVNRPQGATTGAWPWYQAFGGWKGSGSTGKAIGSFYYLPQYLREQSQTIVE